MSVFQSGPYNPGGVSGVLPALFWLLLLQCSAVSAASAAHLLGIPHPANGLQVHVHGQGKRAVKPSNEGEQGIKHFHLMFFCSLSRWSVMSAVMRRVK